jgi:hypothetical protein
LCRTGTGPLLNVAQSLFCYQPEATPAWTDPAHLTFSHCTRAWHHPDSAPKRRPPARRADRASCRFDARHLPPGPSTRRACSRRPWCSAASQPSSSQRRGKALPFFSSSQHSPPSARALRSASHCPPPHQAPSAGQCAPPSCASTPLPSARTVVAPSRSPSSLSRPPSCRPPPPVLLRPCRPHQ